MMDYRSLTGFGNPNDLTTFSFFRIAPMDAQRMYPDWEAPELGSVHQIVGSNDYDEQFMGFGPATMTLTVEFNNDADYQRFRRRASLPETRIGTLVLIAGFTSHDSVIRHINGIDYAYYPNTTMLVPTDITHEIGGVKRCNVTFRRREVL